MLKINHGLRIVKHYKSVRNFSSSSVFLQSAVEPLTIPRPDDEPQSVSPKIQKLVDDIAQLTLVEVTELSKTLKQALNLPDAPFMSMNAASAPAPQADSEEAPKVVKTNYTVKLTKYDDTKKVSLIKEVKGLLEDMNLVQAKKFVESAPVVLKSNVGKEEAEKLKESLEKCGAEITID